MGWHNDYNRGYFFEVGDGGRFDERSIFWVLHGLLVCAERENALNSIGRARICWTSVEKMIG